MSSVVYVAPRLSGTMLMRSPKSVSVPVLVRLNATVVSVVVMSCSNAALPCGRLTLTVIVTGTICGPVAVMVIGVVSSMASSVSSVLRWSSHRTVPSRRAPCVAATMAPGVLLMRISVAPSSMLSGPESHSGCMAPKRGISVGSPSRQYISQ